MSRKASDIPTTRISLIEQCRAGSQDSWQTFFEIYGPIVYRFARYARLSEHDAEDVVANVMRSFMKALRRGFQVDHSIGRFRAYLRKMTNHEIAAQWRRRSAAARSLDDAPPTQDDHGPPDEHWAELERQERLHACLERLRRSPAVRPRDLLAFERYALRGEPAERVAKELGISRARLYGLKHELTQQLRKIRTQLDATLGEV